MEDLNTMSTVPSGFLLAIATGKTRVGSTSPGTKKVCRKC